MEDLATEVGFLIPICKGPPPFSLTVRRSPKQSFRLGLSEEADSLAVRGNPSFAAESATSFATGQRRSLAPRRYAGLFGEAAAPGTQEHSQFEQSALRVNDQARPGSPPTIAVH